MRIYRIFHYLHETEQIYAELDVLSENISKEVTIQ